MYLMSQLDELYDEFDRVILLQKRYMVEAVDRFLRMKYAEFQRHLEEVARRYVETVRLETLRVVEEAHQEAQEKYPPPSA